MLLISYVNDKFIFSARAKHLEKEADRRGKKGKNTILGTTIQSPARSYSQAHRDWMNERVMDGPNEGAVGSDG